MDASRQIFGRRRMFDRLSTNLALVDDSISPRARRNISGTASKRRQDAFSGPITSRRTRPVREGHRWTRYDGIVFANVPSAQRGYAMRQSRPPASRTAEKKPTGQADPVNNPHTISFNSGGALREENKKLQEQLKHETDGHNATRQSLSKMEEVLKSAKAGRLDDERRMQERAQEKQREFDTRFQQLDHEAYERALSSVKQDMKAKIADAEQRLKEARRHEAESSKTKKDLARERAENERFHHTAISENTQHLMEEKAKLFKEQDLAYKEKWEKAEEVRAAQFAEELQQLRSQGEARQRERANYDEYRLLWRRPDSDAFNTSKELNSINDLVEKIIILWSETLRNFRPDAIHAWLSERYPKIVQRVRQMLETKVNEAEQSRSALKDILEGLATAEREVRQSGHHSRKLTSHHRFEPDHTGARSISLCSQFLNEVPIQFQRDRLENQMREVERQVASTIPGQRREQLQQNLTAMKKERWTLAAWLAANTALNKVETLKAVSQSSQKLQEMYLRPLPLKEMMSLGDRAFVAYKRERDSSLDVETWKQQAVFDDIRRGLKTQLSDFERSVAMRQMLEQSLEDVSSDSEGAAFKQTLAQEVAKAETAYHNFVREIVGSKRGSSSPLSARPVRVPSRTSSQTLNTSSSAETAVAFERRALEMKRAIASETSDRAKKRLKLQLQDHNSRYTQWQAQRRKAREEQRKAEAPAGSDDVTPASNVDAPTRSTFRGRRLRDRSRKTSSRVFRFNRPPASEAKEIASSTQSAAGLNLKPTEARQAIHEFWPIFSEKLHFEALQERHADMMGTSVSAALPPGEGSYHSFHASHKVNDTVASSPVEISSSQSSQSSYRPSQSSDAGSLGPPSTADADGGLSEIDKLPELGYNMSTVDHRNALLASPSTASAYWTYKLYKNSEGKTPPVYYCTNLEQAETRMKEFLAEPVIGFDIEWEMRHTPGKSGIKKNVSLIQIAADSKIALLHLAVFKGDEIENLMPPSLRTILESRDVVKAGVNIQGDAWRIAECLGVKMTGIFELSHLYKVVTFSDTPDLINRKPFKLSEQVQDILRLPLKKDAVRTSAWSKRLDMQQTEYAASDAYAGFRLFHALESKRKSMDPTPPRPAFWEEHKPIQLGDGTLIQAKTRKKASAAGTKKSAEVEDDEEDEEFFDAVESIDAYDLGQEATQSVGVPLAGLNVTYPTLPSVEEQLYQSMNDLTISDAPGDKMRQDKASKKSGPPRSEAVDQAEKWVAQWRESRPDEYIVKASHAQLRAYALWHQQSLECKDVAVLLRADTPLSLQTVASYVLEALKRENLEYDVEHVREPFSILPTSVHRRYGKILDEIQK